jgi:hypothetical protein
MENLIDFIKRAANGVSCQRVKFVDNNIPTQASNLIMFPFFGDLRSSFIMSSFLLKRYKERSSKYLILCSWPRFQNLYPYVDEYWTITDQAAVKSLAISANGFSNKGDLNTVLTRKLNEWFENVISFNSDFSKYYNTSFEELFWKNFGDLKYFLPEVPSESILPESFRNQFVLKQGKKILIYPTTSIRSWQMNNVTNVSIDYSFWEYLCKRLLATGYMPIIYQNPFTYDLSKTMADQCIFVVPNDISQLLSIMRLTGCVLDVYSGISRLALIARCPFVATDERLRYINQKDNELDSLCGDKIPHRYIFSYASLTATGNEASWDSNIINSILSKLDGFLPSLDRDTWPSTEELEEVLDFSKVVEYRAKKLGVHFLSSAKDK